MTVQGPGSRVPGRPAPSPVPVLVLVLALVLVLDVVAPADEAAPRPEPIPLRPQSALLRPFLLLPPASPEVLPAGVLAWEGAGTYAVTRESDAGTPARDTAVSISGAFGAATGRARLGLGSGLEASVATGYGWWRENPKTGEGPDVHARHRGVTWLDLDRSVRGPLDSTLGVTARLVEGAGACALRAAVSIPGGDPDRALGTGRAAAAFGGMAGGPLGAGVWLDVTSG